MPRKKKDDTDSQLICGASSPIGNCLRKPHKDKWHVTDSWVACAIDENRRLETVHVVGSAWIWFSSKDPVPTSVKSVAQAILNNDYLPLLITRLHAINLIRADIKRIEANEKWQKDNTLDD